MLFDKRQKTHTIRKDGTLISKPDTFLAVGEEDTITPNRHIESPQEEEVESEEDQPQTAEEDQAQPGTELAKQEESHRSQRKLRTELWYDTQLVLRRETKTKLQHGTYNTQSLISSLEATRDGGRDVPIEAENSSPMVNDLNHGKVKDALGNNASKFKEASCLEKKTSTML